MLALLYYLALLGIPVLLVGIAVRVDRRTQRGFGLALLALMLIALTVWGVVAFEQALQRAPSTEGFGIAIALVVYFLIGSYLALVLWMGALIEAGSARQRRWLASLVVAALLSGLIVLGGTPVLNLKALGLGFFVGDTGFALIILVPTATVLAYGVGRSIRPRTGARRNGRSQNFTTEDTEDAETRGRVICCVGAPRVRPYRVPLLPSPARGA